MTGKNPARYSDILLPKAYATSPAAISDKEFNSTYSLLLLKSFELLNYLENMC